MTFHRVADSSSGPSVANNHRRPNSCLFLARGNKYLNSIQLVTVTTSIAITTTIIITITSPYPLLLTMGWRTLSITLSTSFLLGITFTHWIADHNVLWTSPVTPAAISTSISYYTILGNADPGLYWAWCGVAGIALAAAGWRVGRGLGGVKGGEGGGWLFDGGSLGKLH